ncbi:MAG: UDP-N-acetylmuramoyl-tripeptide--D-alanyl-D-alanine ligase [Bacteroidaceae bacterium]|nr:UDP-N-acetylmuramoyl-tripeptide--D-alanyl-D-alanine ligase [Bacteroidaceae bacterium]
MNIEELYQVYLQHPIVTTDSRNCPEGSVFFALRGEKFNGNAYARQALEAGCAAAVVDEPEVALDERFILVPDVLQALQQLAALHRRKWGGTVLQITGTNGKTTTKELVSAVLAKKFNVLFTQGNFNNHIGVPLTLLRLTARHDLAVVETGANHPGEIAALSRIAQADYGIITNVGRAHLEGFGSFEGVRATKGELYDDLSARGGKVFLNAFDDDLLQMAEGRGLKLYETAIPYVEGRVEQVNPFLTFRWRQDVDEDWHQVATHLVGAYNIDNVRAAVTVGLHFGVPADLIDEAVAGYVPRNSRSEFRQSARNKLIVDAYNANPSSMAAALTNFSFICNEPKMVILGDMQELGEESDAEHQKVLTQLADSRIGQIWLVGPKFRQAAEVLGFSPSQVRFFPDVEAVKACLDSEPVEGFTILIKGSNSMRLHELPDLL